MDMIQEISANIDGRLGTNEDFKDVCEIAQTGT